MIGQIISGEREGERERNVGGLSNGGGDRVGRGLGGGRREGVDLDGFTARGHIIHSPAFAGAEGRAQKNRRGESRGDSLCRFSIHNTLGMNHSPTLMSSTSKMRSAFGGITGGAPAGP